MEYVAEDDQRYATAGGLLPGVVASAVGYASHGPLGPVHRGLPSPYLTFIITLNEPVIGGHSIEQATGPGANRLDILAAGLHTRPTYIAQRAGQAGLQLSVYPLAVRRIFGVPVSELADNSYDGASVIGRSVADLRERVIESPDWEARFALLQAFLQDRCERTEHLTQPRPEIAEAWRWLARHRGTGSVGGLAEHVHLSRRQLQDLFVREFGVGPKNLNRLLRFHRSVRMITERVAAGLPPGLAEVAAHCGYADQSHLNRDFRDFTGTSPSCWIAEELGSIRAGGHRNGDELR